MAQFRPPEKPAPAAVTRSGRLARLSLWGLFGALAGLLGGLGWWSYASVESAVKGTLADQLRTVRDADVTALKLWIGQQETFARAAAGRPQFRADAAELLAVRAATPTPDALLRCEAHRRLRDGLAELCREGDFTGYSLAADDGTVLSSSAESRVGRQPPVDPQPELWPLVRAGKTVVSRPFLDRPEGGKGGGVPTMWVAAPVPGAAASLTLFARPEAGFTSILSVARPGESGETYAFDANGLMLSQSRFDDDLRRIGLIGPEASSILNLELRDPGDNLTAGGRAVGGRFAQPLTRAVRDAAAGNTGDDVGGYPDYRGVPVVGAWTWLAPYGFGVATEVDVEEAYRPLGRLRLVFWVLFAALAATTAGAAVAAVLIVSARRARRRLARLARVGQYVLDEKLGEGGMGEVFRASHALLRRPTAIKFLRGRSTSAKAVARFEREVQLTSRLQHPNTIAVYDFGRTDGGDFYYVMEYLDGITLDELVRRDGPQPEARVLHVLGQLCGALEEAHGVGLVHRDVKPANVMLCRRWRACDVVKVLDFGLVKDIGDPEAAKVTTAGGLTTAEGLTGTPFYMAPEAIYRPDVVEVGRDIYAVGAVGYFLLAGRNVFEGASVFEVLQHHCKSEPPPLARRLGRPVDADLEGLLLRCLAKDPAGRPASAGELLALLQGCVAWGKWSKDDAAAAWERHGPAAWSGESAPPPDGVATSPPPDLEMTAPPPDEYGSTPAADSDAAGQTFRASRLPRRP